MNDLGTITLEKLYVEKRIAVKDRKILLHFQFGIIMQSFFLFQCLMIWLCAKWFSLLLRSRLVNWFLPKYIGTMVYSARHFTGGLVRKEFLRIWHTCRGFEFVIRRFCRSRGNWMRPLMAPEFVAVARLKVWRRCTIRLANRIHINARVYMSLLLPGKGGSVAPK